MCLKNFQEVKIGIAQQFFRYLELMQRSRRQIKFEGAQSSLAQREQGASSGASRCCLSREHAQRAVGKTKVDVIDGEGSLVLFEHRALRGGEDLEVICFVQRMTGDAHRQSPDELGFESVADEVGGRRVI